jgi:hypothetical protein
MNDLENKKFPIGPFEAPENICDTTLDVYIQSNKRLSRKTEKSH